MLEPLTTNEYIIKDSFKFAEELQIFCSKLMMTRSDTESLFPNILCKKQLTSMMKIYLKTHVDNLLQDSFRELLTRTLSESLIFI